MTRGANARLQPLDWQLSLSSVFQLFQPVSGFARPGRRYRAAGGRQRDFRGIQTGKVSAPGVVRYLKHFAAGTQWDRS